MKGHVTVTGLGEHTIGFRAGNMSSRIAAVVVTSAPTQIAISWIGKRCAGAGARRSLACYDQRQIVTDAHHSQAAGEQ